MANMQIPDFSQQQAYRVEVQVTDIKSTSAVISGSYKEIYPEGSIINMGYIIEGSDSKQDVSAFGLTSTTIKLEPDTKYTVYAYLASASAPGGRYMSQPVTFKTKTDESFALSTTDVEFEPEGGSMTIDVYAPDGVTWSIQDVPSWLEVTTTDNTITISATSRADCSPPTQDPYRIPFRPRPQGKSPSISALTADTDPDIS